MITLDSQNLNLPSFMQHACEIISRSNHLSVHKSCSERRQKEREGGQVERHMHGRPKPNRPCHLSTTLPEGRSHIGTACFVSPCSSFGVGCTAGGITSQLLFEARNDRDCLLDYHETRQRLARAGVHRYHLAKLLDRLVYVLDAQSAADI